MEKNLGKENMIVYWLYWSSFFLCCSLNVLQDYQGFHLFSIIDSGQRSGTLEAINHTFDG